MVFNNLFCCTTFSARMRIILAKILRNHLNLISTLTSPNDKNRQQVSEASVAVHDQPFNKQQPVVAEVVEQAKWLTNIEQYVDVIRAAIERMEAMVM